MSICVHSCSLYSQWTGRSIDTRNCNLILSRSSDINKQKYRQRTNKSTYDCVLDVHSWMWRGCMSQVSERWTEIRVPSHPAVLARTIEATLKSWKTVGDRSALWCVNSISQSALRYVNNRGATCALRMPFFIRSTMCRLSFNWLIFTAQEFHGLW